MNDVAITDLGIANMLLDVICDVLPSAILVYDRSDHLIYAGGQVQILASVPETLLVPGTRLRDILSAIFDGLDPNTLRSARSRRTVTKENWIAEQISSLWKERVEHFEKRGSDRWIQYIKRRLPNGYGVCIVRDASEQKNREEQWRIGTERIEIVEEVLDELPFPVCVKSAKLVYVAVNQAFCHFVGRSPKDIVGQMPSDLFEDAVAKRLEGAGRQIIKNGISVTSHELLAGPDGSEVGAVVRKFRVGKPGRYHVVTAMEPVSASAEEGHVGSLGVAVKPVSVQQGLALQEIEGKKVLVVTTDEAAAAGASEALSRLGAETSIVSDAEELELFLSFAQDAGVAVDLILMDDELALSCAAAAKKHQVPVVAVDTTQIESDALNLVAEIFERSTTTRQPTPAPAPTDQMIDVLVAEDNPVNQIVFSQILEGFGYRYAIAANGVEAVRLWHDRSPRIVLMDVTLPEMNGFEACRRIRELEAGAVQTPIVGVLAHPFDRDRDECFASGMDDVILKPISPEMLEAVLLSQMHRREAGTA